ncbi:hypothetical protein CIG19_01335 [Enterobacterales bacterium CwR94]|nr:hypothetical protein CIG19_01335 [Enterobacterales bacterium CwR94]
MKFWLPGVVMLVMAGAVHAADYRAVYSPSLELEVWIDNVVDNAPDSWCKETLPLRIVSGESKKSTVLETFLPRVGTLLQNQCGTLNELPWALTDKQGSVLATGTALRIQSWKPIVTADATVDASEGNAAPLDLSRPANDEPLQHFDLPGGCHFRTWWDNNGQSLFIPDDASLRCSTEGWLQGDTSLVMTRNNQSEQLDVSFFEGYPLRNLQPKVGEVEVVTVNNQRMVLAKEDAPQSWLLLPFDAGHHIWSFNGTLLVQMDKNQAQDAAAIKSRVDAVREAWQSQLGANTPVNVLLVDALHTELADPAIGAWRTVSPAP